MRLSPNLHMGLVLGIATTGVILALSGCVTSTAAMPAVSAPAADVGEASTTRATLAQFSEPERERILAVQGVVDQAAKEHGVDPTLINAVIWVESRFDPHAKSPAGARGLMQLMPATAAYLAKRMGEHNPRAYDPEFNVRAGALYLAEMIEKFGDETYAVAAYHGGPGNVRRWLEAGERFPDYSETYVAKVMDARARFEGVEVHGRSSSERPVAPKPAPAPKPGPEPEPEPEPEPLEVPEDIDALPDAAEIHGVARVIHVAPEPQSAPEPPAGDAIEPVFEVHPELDANPDASTGWHVSERAPRQKPASKPEPKPEPKPESKPESKSKPAPEETGIGVLPDL